MKRNGGGVPLWYVVLVSVGLWMPLVAVSARLCSELDSIITPIFEFDQKNEKRKEFQVVDLLFCSFFSHAQNAHKEFSKLVIKISMMT